jgi:aspartate/glutamate racemase
MTTTLVLIHTVKPLIPVFEGLANRYLPGVKVFHILDEPLLETIRLRGSLAQEDAQRVTNHILQAERSGADVVLVTCSTISPCVDNVCNQISLPLVKIDDAMIAKAIQCGKRIGVIATNVTTIEPTHRLLEAQARSQQKKIEIESKLVAHALDALFAGDVERHDALVIEAIGKLRKCTDVIVLAQASTARVLDLMSDIEKAKPILGSPQLALEQVKEILKSQNKV